MENNVSVGSISENGLFQKLFTNPDIKQEKIKDIMELPFPMVDYNAPLERISLLISKEIGAVLALDETGNFQIVTKYDLLQSLTK
jgi:cystathionine beta-synthase